jgi:hypothetical protein
VETLEIFLILNLKPRKICLPVYDDAATIYSDLLTRLNAAIPNLTNSGFGASDPIYAGNPALKKFGN